MSEKQTYDERRKAAEQAVKEFVETGKWPAPGVLPVNVAFRKPLGGF